MTVMSESGDTTAFDFSSDAPSRRTSSALSLNKHFAISKPQSSSQQPVGNVKTLKYPEHKRSFSHIRDPKNAAGTTVEPAIGAIKEEEPHQTGHRTSLGFPFLRALHAFDPLSLPANASAPEEDVTEICLRFDEGDIALLHSVHASGWGDATLLTTGSRGWIPTNYFVAYSDPKVVPLLSAILNFVINPKPLELHGNSSGFTFSQGAITEIVSGVRALLDACGTLTRDSPTVKKSQAVRKFRKNLLAELAILVSLAKQYRNSTEDSVIERLISGCYKIASKAVFFLDVWSIDTNVIDENGDNEPEYVTTPSENHPIDNEKENVYGSELELSKEGTKRAMPPPKINTSSNSVPRKPGEMPQHANRESVIFHTSPPTALQRLDEVNDALTAYLGIFIHRMPFLESDPTASTQILVNTRKSMLACRELLAAVESISSKQQPRSKELEQTKDKLFAQIRELVTSARDVVAHTTPKYQQDGDGYSHYRQGSRSTISSTAGLSNGGGGEVSASGKKLIGNATDCARTAGECVVRCRAILNKIGDFQMSSAREYPDFSDGVIAIPNYRIKGSDSLVAPSYLLNDGNSSAPATPTTAKHDISSPVSPTNTTKQKNTPPPVSIEHSNGSTSGLGNLPDNSNLSVINSSNGATRSGTVNENENLLPQIPSMSPIMPTHAVSNPNSPSDPYFKEPTSPMRAGNVQGRKMSEISFAEKELIFVDPSEYPADSQYVLDPNTGRIRGGSLQVLINILTDEKSEQDPFLVSTFFLTFRLFATPQKVFDCLLARYAVDVNEDKLVLKDLEDISSRRAKVFNFVKRWLESHWKQSLDGVILDQIIELADKHFVKVIPNARSIIHDLASKVTGGMLEDGEPIVPRTVALPNGRPARAASNTYHGLPAAPITSVGSSSAASSMSRHLVHQLTKINESNGYRPFDAQSISNENDVKSAHTGPTAITTTTTTSSAWSSSLRLTLARNSTFSNTGLHNQGTNVCIMDIDPADVAIQLTVMDSALFCQLQPEELLGRNFGKKRGEIGKSPNVAMMAALTNQLSSFVGDTILSGDAAPKQRRNILKHWIKVAERCVELRNFNSLVGIVSVLQSVNIQRLRKTWDLLSPRYHAMFNSLKEISSPERNFAGYRNQIRTKEPPCVPFLGVYLSDLTFLVEGNVRERHFEIPRTSDEEIESNQVRVIKVINFDLYERIAKVVGEIQKFQVPYRLPVSKELQTWLRGEMLKAHAQVSKGDELWRRSCIIEPKNH
ncbi:hypothetical protein TRVA0_020S00980 [Trichomonascus vanleenenianus]|uniref:guanine nucleotide exchange factor n=1 Tax=Trichomonascus vanleenenianus TaxID=2268995 RepID=UPI003ECA8478